MACDLPLKIYVGLPGKFLGLTNAEFTPLHFLVAGLDFPRNLLYNGFIRFTKNQKRSDYYEKF